MVAIRGECWVSVLCRRRRLPHLRQVRGLTTDQLPARWFTFSVRLFDRVLHSSKLGRLPPLPFRGPEAAMPIGVGFYRVDQLVQPARARVARRRGGVL